MLRLFIVTLKIYENGKPIESSKKKFGTLAYTIETASSYVLAQWNEIDGPTEKSFEWKAVHVIMSDLDLLIPKQDKAIVSMPPEED